MKKVLEDRRNNPPREEEERLFIDAVIDLDVSEEVRLADMVSTLIAGFHTTGLRQ